MHKLSHRNAARAPQPATGTPVKSALPDSGNQAAQEALRVAPTAPTESGYLPQTPVMPHPSAASKKNGSTASNKAPGWGFGTDVDALVGQSPTLNNNLQTLQAQGWTFVTGAKGGGTYADRTNKQITLDAGTRDPLDKVQSLSHEAGHGLDTKDRYVGPGGLDRGEYVKQNVMGHLRGEAEATINNLQVRDELMQGKKPVDIGVAGAGNPQYKQLWKQYKAGKLNRSELVDGIANGFGKNEVTSNTKENYSSYYSQPYDKFYQQYKEQIPPPEVGP